MKKTKKEEKKEYIFVRMAKEKKTKLNKLVILSGMTMNSFMLALINKELDKLK